MDKQQKIRNLEAQIADLKAESASWCSICMRQGRRLAYLEQHAPPGLPLYPPAVDAEREYKPDDG